MSEPAGFDQLPSPPYPPVLPARLENIARSVIIVDGVTQGFRQGIDVIGGDGITVVGADDPVNEKVTLTVGVEAGVLQTVGDVKASFQTANHGNWLLLNGGSFSGATYPNLAALLGGTTLPDGRGRDLIGAGTGPGLTARTLNTTGGAETVTQTALQVGQHAHGMNSHTHNLNNHTHSLTGTHDHDMAQHSHTLNSHTHNLTNHVHDAGNHVHGVPSSSDSFWMFDSTSPPNTVAGAAGLLTVRSESATGVAIGDTGNPTTLPASATPSTANTGLAGAGSGQAAVNTTNTANSGSSGIPSPTGSAGPSIADTEDWPTSAATAMAIMNPFLVVNWFIYAT